MPALKRVVTSMSRDGVTIGGELVELLRVVDGEGADAELFIGARDLALVLDRVVVVHHGARRISRTSSISVLEATSNALRPSRCSCAMMWGEGLHLTA